MFGLDPEIHRRIKNEIAKFKQIERVLIYGSRAKGNYRNGSDIDITLIGEGLDLIDTIYPLRDALDELYLPYTFDISIFSQLDNPEFISHILRVSKVFYQRNAESEMEWQQTTLGEAYDVRDGTHDSPKYQETGYPLITSKNLKPAGLNFDKVKYISDNDFKKINERSGVRKGDVLFAMIGTIGNPIIVEVEPNFAIKNVALFKVPENQNEKFLKYYLESKYVIEKMIKEAKGTTQKFVGLGYLRGFPIALPSIPEQKRIVALLDTVFADLEQARAKTEQNLKNARELFDSYLQQVFSQKGDGWVETTLGEISGGVATGPFGSLLHKSDYIENGIPLVNPAHIVGQKVVPDTRKTISEETALRLSAYKMKVGDIVIGRRGEMGRCALITQNEDGYLCGTGSFIIKSSDRCDGGFLIRFLRSASCVASLEKIAGGAVMPNLSNSSLSKFGIRVPSKNKQIEITKLIDKLSIEIEKVIDIYNEKLNSIDELKKSILQKAFSGELATTAK